MAKCSLRTDSMSLVWLAATFFSILPARASADSAALFSEGKVQAAVVAPEGDDHSAKLVASTLNGYCLKSFGWELPLVQQVSNSGLLILVGNEENNPALKELSIQGLDLHTENLSEEGFRIVTHERGDCRYVIVTAKSPVGLKHGCQELMYFRTSATPDHTEVDWPLDVTMNPQIGYRGCYMLPCWAAYDSMESWRRLLSFHSELTLNRNWFWLNGFPLLPQYGGLYAGTELAQLENVRELIELCHTEGLKFLIGGGWFTWHHKEAASGSSEHRLARVGAGGGEEPIAATPEMIQKGVQYYLDLMAALPEADGLYLEPTGEGGQAQNDVWRHHVDALGQLTSKIWVSRPEFEIVLAIGKFNSPSYRKAIHELAPEKIHWYWGWGNPLEDQALNEHPLVLRWHTTQTMSPFHGSISPPQPAEAVLTGVTTSWDPGMGFGNPWNGWAKIGIDHPRNFDPYTMPYFSHQYLYRERCWNLNLTDAEFAARLSRRLFDSDLPEESIQLYLQLAAMCRQPENADAAHLLRCTEFAKRYAGKGTPRNRDTIARMQEAINGINASRQPNQN